jgi:hypothetical protein
MMQKPYGALGYKLRRIITIGYGNSNPMEIFIEKSIQTKHLTVEKKVLISVQKIQKAE